MTEQKPDYKIEGRPSTIFRTIKNKDNPYVMVDRRTIDNDKLSFKAKGILTYLLSRPDGWEVNLVDLSKRGTDGLAAIKSGVKELKEAGYLKHAGTRSSVTGQFGTVIWEVYEVPQVGNQLTGTPDMVVGSPQVDLPQAENPQVDNHMQVLSTLSSKELSSSEATGIIFTTYENNIGPLFGMMVDKIGDAIDTYPHQWILEAIQEAVTHNARNWAYIEKILKTWQAKGRANDKPLDKMSDVDKELLRMDIKPAHQVIEEMGLNDVSDEEQKIKNQKILEERGLLFDGGKE